MVYAVSLKIHHLIKKGGKAVFEIGDRVAYPMHGAGIVELIEEKEILGQLQRYYVLRFALGRHEGDGAC